MNLSEKIKSFIYSNIVPNNKRTIGVEIEGLYYDNHFKRLPVNPTDKYSATDLLYDIKELDCFLVNMASKEILNTHTSFKCSVLILKMRSSFCITILGSFSS